jgi:hypothetical protein
MKSFLILLFTLISFLGITQCNQYFIYESFTGALPTQGGTWGQSSIGYSTVSVRTGNNNLSFNGNGDFIRTPIISNPSVVTFWIRRSGTNTTHNFVVETSTDNTNWTIRNTYSANPTATYNKRTIDLTSLNLVNVYIRIRDTRSTGTNVWYLDDFGVTSSNSNSNTIIPFESNCSQTLTSSLTYTITDRGGTTDNYANSLDQTVTLTPSDNTKKLQLNFSSFNLESSWDYLYVYDGPNTSSPLLATLNGTSLPATITAENASGQLTLRFTSDVSGVRSGFQATVTSITVCTTPTNGGTLSSTKTNTTVNDATTLTTTGNGGTITKLEWSFNNFTSVAGTISSPTNPYTIIMNVQQSQIYFRTTSKDGTCPSGNSNIVTVNLNNATPYTTASGTYGVQDGDYISNVTLSNINNTSTNDGDSYENFKSQIIDVTKGTQYTLSVTATNTFSSGQGYSAWIDWNGDGVFQATENVLQSAPANSTSQTITVPLDATTGDVLMRVLSVWGTTPSTDAYSTTTYRWGEIEEYTVRISVALPVELLYFEGLPYPTFNKLIWSTASEYNSDYFQIERSVDGETWETVGIKSASGNSTIKINYNHLDSFDEFLIYYYILKQVDYDGQYKIYGPISLDNTKSFKKVVKYVNLLGQEVNFYTEGLLIEVYEDGTMNKIIR